MAAVVEWIHREPSVSLCTTTVTEAEIFYGIALVPAGKRHAALVAAAERVFLAFERRLLPFDSAGGARLATLAAKRKHAGHAIAFADAPKSRAIARVHGATIRSAQHR